MCFMLLILDASRAISGTDFLLEVTGSQDCPICFGQDYCGIVVRKWREIRLCQFELAFYVLFSPSASEPQQLCGDCDRRRWQLHFQGKHACCSVLSGVGTCAQYMRDINSRPIRCDHIIIPLWLDRIQPICCTPSKTARWSYRQERILFT